MTTSSLSAYLRLKTRTNSTTLSDDDLLILANKVKNDLVLAGLKINEDLFLVPTYLNLVANQREYPLHSNILSRIKRVEAKLDGTNFLKLTEIDLTEHDEPVTPEANITYNFSNNEGEAFYDIMRKSIWIYSGTITSVTDGLRIWVNTWPADFVAMNGSTDMSVDPSTTTHGFPKEMHGVLAEGMVIEWKESREKPIPLTQSEQNHESHVKDAADSLKRANYDRQVLGGLPKQPIYIGDDGQDY